MKKIEVNGMKFHIKITGEGEPLILVHGLGLDHTMWRLQQPAFSKHFKVISYDVRGHGQTDRSKNYTLEDHARDLANLMDELGVEKAHIMGLSMGTYICQQFVTSYPEKVDKLVLAATKCNGQTSSLQKLVDEKRNKGETVELDSILEILAKACFLDGGTEEHLKLFYDSAQYNTLDSFEEAMKALTDFDFRSNLPHVKAHTLVLNGDLDVLTTLDQAQEVDSHIPDSRLIVLKGSGHCCNIEKPDTFNAIVLDFLIE